MSEQNVELTDNKTPCEYVKIYGERNTGTNVLEQTIQKNFDCEVLPGNHRLPDEDAYELARSLGFAGSEYFMFVDGLQADSLREHLHQDLGWKHACPPLEVIQNYKNLDKTLFIVISKDPYNWLLSFHRRPYNQLTTQKLDFSSFIRYFWITSHKEFAPRTIIKNPVVLYSIKMQSYIQLEKTVCHFIHIPYLEFLFNFEEVMLQLAAFIKPVSENFSRCINSAKGDGVSVEEYKQKYSKDPLDLISKMDAEFISSQLDQNVLDHWGYQLRTADKK